MSKGDNRRPGDDEAYRRNYDRIFGKSKAQGEASRERQRADEPDQCTYKDRSTTCVLA